MQNLFAFNVSKKAMELPELLFVYNPDQQVGTWVGGNTALSAVHCTQNPYNGIRCQMQPTGLCLHTTDIIRFTNSRCEI